MVRLRFFVPRQNGLSPAFSNAIGSTVGRSVADIMMTNDEMSNLI